MNYNGLLLPWHQHRGWHCDGDNAASCEMNVASTGLIGELDYFGRGHDDDDVSAIV